MTDYRNLLRLAEQAGIAFQRHRGAGDRINITTCGSIPIAKIQALVDLARREEREGITHSPESAPPSHPSPGRSA